MAKNIAGMTPEQMRDPNYFPGFVKGIPLGIQHVLAMFVSNVTPAIIVAGAAGFGFGSGDIGDMIYMIQMSMLFAGIATLIQTISLGPVGAKLPVVQGTSFAFIPVMIPIALTWGMDALMGAIIVGGVFHFFLGTIIGRVRHWLPPLVTGLVVLMIGLALVKVGIQYAAGGVPMIGKPGYGSLLQWSLALVVIFVTLGLKFFTRGMLSVSAVLLGLLAGYAVAFGIDAVTGSELIKFGNVEKAAWSKLPEFNKFGIEWNITAIIGMCLMSIVSAIETVGDISGITKGGAGREATDKEVAGGTMADGLGTALSGAFGALPNTSFSQNVGLISMTGVMSRHVVTLGAIFLIIAGLVPKFGAVISTMPIAVLGGGVIVMFGMVAAAGVNMLSSVVWTRRNMMIFATALSIGLGLQLEPGALQHLPKDVTVLMTSGLLPAALIAIILNLIIPEDKDELALVSGGQLGGGHADNGRDAARGTNDLAGEPSYDRAPRGYDEPRYADSPRYSDEAQYDDRPRYDDRPVRDDRPQYEERPVYDDRPRYEERPRYDDRPRFEDRPNYEDRYDNRPRDPRGPRDNNRR